MTELYIGPEPLLAAEQAAMLARLDSAERAPLHALRVKMLAHPEG